MDTEIICNEGNIPGAIKNLILIRLAVEVPQV
jgi:ribosomal protein L3